MVSRLEEIFRYLTEHELQFIQRLADAVAIPSVSTWPTHRQNCRKMIEWTRQCLENLGSTTEIIPLELKESNLPPLLFAMLGANPAKKTLLIYGHLDVQPALKSDGWTTEPFELTRRDGILLGRGSTDDKGPVCAWLNCIEAYSQTGQQLPVNLKFIFECAEEIGSVGLEETLRLHKSFLDGVDFICISDNYWLTPNKPCLTYGLRGNAYFEVSVECSKRDLHSGIYGGAVHEAMWDLVALLDTLVSSDGHILIEGIYDDVLPIEEKEAKLYEIIDFDHDHFLQSEVGTSKLLYAEKAQLLQHRWRYPALSMHGIEGDFSEPGAKTVIPRKVIGKFSIRQVHNMNLETVEKLVVNHLRKEFDRRQSPNILDIKMVLGFPPWLADYNDPNYQAARRAIKTVWQIDPDMTREGCSIPITLILQKLTDGKNVLLLPIGQPDDGAHSNNEKISIKNYTEGAKLMAAYLEELGLSE